MKKCKCKTKNSFCINYKNFMETINHIHTITKKNKYFLILDSIYCHFKYLANFNDYNLFEMYNMNRFERKTVITYGKNLNYVKKYNNEKYIHYFKSNKTFYIAFKDYLNREYLVLDGKNVHEFKTFCAKHPVIYAKTEYPNKVEKINTKEENKEELYERLIDKDQFLIEEEVTLCKRLNDLNPNCMSKLQIITLLGKVVASFLSVDVSPSANDNELKAITPVNIEKGQIFYPAVDKNKNLYANHPVTGKKIVGLKIPKWKEIIEFCENASLEIPEIGYVSWNICVGEDKCFLLDANNYPSHMIYQLPPHRESNIGLLPKFKNVEERKIEK